MCTEMALAKNSRVDGRIMSSYSSNLTIIAFIVLCLGGVWMMTSTTVIPVQNIEMSTEETNSGVKGQVVIETESQQVQDSSGDVGKDGIAKIPLDDPNPEVNQNRPAKTNGNQVEESREETSIKESEDTEKNKPNDQPEKETETVSEESSRTETSNEEDSIKDTEDPKNYIKESNDASKNESQDGNESGKKPKTETTKESDDASKSETGSESDDTNKTEADKESDDSSRTKFGNESNDDASKTENKNDGNEKTKSIETVTAGDEVNSERKEPNTGNETNAKEQGNAQDKESEGEKNSTTEETSDKTAPGAKVQGQIEEKVEQNQGNEPEKNSIENMTGDQASDEVFPDPAQSELLNETNTQNGTFSTQALESKNEKEAQHSPSTEGQAVNKVFSDKDGDAYSYNWKLCNVTVGADYIPCLDNEEAIKKLRSTMHYEHRERHCPEEGPTCLVPLPKGYRQPIQWPSSRDKVQEHSFSLNVNLVYLFSLVIMSLAVFILQIWYCNVPHTQLVRYKGRQNWVKVTGEHLIFPGGGTQFRKGAPHYIDFIEEVIASNFFPLELPFSSLSFLVS